MRYLKLLSLLLLILGACQPAELKPDVASFTGIHGTVSDPSGQPISGAVVYAYRNPGSGLRGPADFAATTDEDGRYLLDLTPGSFHLVARLRSGGSESGPPRPGDAWALPSANPVSLDEKQTYRLNFTLQPIGDQRIIANTLTAAPYRFTGQVRTSEGKALAGAVVLAYRQPQIHRRPDYAATPAKADGRFNLYLPDPGPWCLVVRQYTRGQLRATELYALIGNLDDACSLEATDHTDLGEITLIPFRGQ